MAGRNVTDPESEDSLLSIVPERVHVDNVIAHRNRLDVWGGAAGNAYPIITIFGSSSGNDTSPTLHSYHQGNA